MLTILTDVLFVASVSLSVKGHVDFSEMISASKGTVHLTLEYVESVCHMA